MGGTHIGIIGIALHIHGMLVGMGRDGIHHIMLGIGIGLLVGVGIILCIIHIGDMVLVVIPVIYMDL